MQTLWTLPHTASPKTLTYIYLLSRQRRSLLESTLDKQSLGPAHLCTVCKGGVISALRGSFDHIPSIGNCLCPHMLCLKYSRKKLPSLF